MATHMWNTRQFERYLYRSLREQCDEATASTLISAYDSTRMRLVFNIFDQIPAVEPHLSDHGRDHIGNVLDNVLGLTSEDSGAHGLSALDLYVLGMGVLFHDVGNLFGRTGHNKKITEVYDWARGTYSSIHRERNLILRLAAAHTGRASDGTRDTLKEIEETGSLNGQIIHLRTLAAILRFADELAEGPQRTSEFRRGNNLYEIASHVYHAYASSTDVTIDRPNGRILLTYDIDFAVNGSASLDNGTALEDFLRFVYWRAIKLDQERRYGRFYSMALQPFRETRIVFQFSCQRRLLSLDLAPINLNDKNRARRR